jgi:TetR/AcrR family transcriptional regulator
MGVKGRGGPKEAPPVAGKNRTAPRAAGAAVPAEDRDTKTAILKAALEVFARDGFDGTSLPKIAEVVGVGHPLIHYHFGSKDNLWRHAVANSIGVIVAEADAIGAASRDLAPLDKLRVLIRMFTIFSARYPSHLAILMFEIRGKTERLDWLMQTYLDPIITRWGQILKEAQDLGQIKPAPIPQLISIITGAITQHFSINPYLREDYDAEKLAQQHADLVIDVILSGLLVKEARPDPPSR